MGVSLPGIIPFANSSSFFVAWQPLSQDTYEDISRDISYPGRELIRVALCQYYIIRGWCNRSRFGLRD